MWISKASLVEAPHSFDTFAEKAWPAMLGNIHVVYSVAWCGVAQCGVVQCGVVWYGTVWCGMVQCGVAQFGVVRCGVVWYGTVWCSVPVIVSCVPVCLACRSLCPNTWGHVSGHPWNTGL